MVHNSTRSGRPRGFDPSAALDASMRLFWAQGYEATSLDDLEAATGLSRSSLYNTFGSKHDLFDRSLLRYVDVLEQHLLGPLGSGSAGLADLVRFFDRLGTQLDGGGAIAGCLLTNSLVEFAGTDELVVRRGRAYVDRAREAIRAALDRAARLGELDEISLAERADLLVGLVLSINLFARSGLGRPAFTALVDSVRAEIRAWGDPSGRIRREASGRP